MTTTEQKAAQPSAGEPAARDEGVEALGAVVAAPVLQVIDPLDEHGVYGERGWTARIGLWPLLRRLRARSGDGEECSPIAGPAGTGEGWPVGDYTGYAGLGADEAAELLRSLPEAALEDRQNLGPSLRSLLEACAGAGDSVLLAGYAIGPQRRDERLTADALWVRDADLASLRVPPVHGPECDCERLWSAVRERYRLDARCQPDEIRREAPPWGGGDSGWWMWWD